MNKKLIITISITILALALIAVGVLFFVKIVNANQLSCSISNTNNGLKIEQKYIIKYTKDIVSSVAITKSFSFDDQKRFDTFNSVVVPSTNTSMKKIVKDNIKFSSSVSGKTYSTKTIINVDKASKADVAEIGVNKSLKTLKSNLETQGLVCK